MKWAKDADAAIRGVPFFVRKRVRAKQASDAVALYKADSTRGRRFAEVLTASAFERMGERHRQ